MAKKSTTTAPVLETLSSLNLRADLPAFKAGDKVVVRSKIKEGEKERVQAFEGVVIALNGRGVARSMTLRKVSYGVGVERVFPLNAPTIVSIEVKTEGFVRRSKLYYLRKLQGKASRIQDKNLRLLGVQGGAQSEGTQANS